MFPAPATMNDDERAIGSNYSGLRWLLGFAMAAAPTIAVYYADWKLAFAIASFTVIGLLNEIGARLYDLCIRHRRTNLLLAERGGQ